MKKITSILTVAIMITTFAACKNSDRESGSAENYRIGTMTEPQADAVRTYANGGAGGGANSDYYDGGGDNYADSGGDSEYGVAADFSEDILRKIIKNAYMNIESDTPSALYTDISAYCYTIGGYEFSCDVQNYKELSTVTAVLKIPPGKLNDFMNYAGLNGKIVNSGISSDDVSAAYYDAKTRLETKRVSLGSYYALLEKATSTSDIVYLQQIIDGITEEIEAYEGKIRMYDSLVDMATVKLSITQPAEEKEEEKPLTMWQTTKKGFMTTLNVVISFFQWLFAIIIMLSPVWVIIAAIVGITLAVKRNNRKKRANASQNAPQPIEAIAEPPEKPDSE